MIWFNYKQTLSIISMNYEVRAQNGSQDNRMFLVFTVFLYTKEKSNENLQFYAWGFKNPPFVRVGENDIRVSMHAEPSMRKQDFVDYSVLSVAVYGKYFTFIVEGLNELTKNYTFCSMRCSIYAEVNIECKNDSRHTLVTMVLKRGISS